MDALGLAIRMEREREMKWMFCSIKIITGTITGATGQDSSLQGSSK